MRTLLYFFALLSVASCANGPEATIRVRGKLPASIGKYSGRHQSFLSRATHIEVSISQGSDRSQHRFPIQQWEQMPLAVDFTRSSESISIEVQIWDTHRNGMPRRYAALVGKGTLSREESQLTIPMRLRLSPQEYD